MRHPRPEKRSSSPLMISIRVSGERRERRLSIGAKSCLPERPRTRQSVMRTRRIFGAGLTVEAARRNYLQRHCYRDEEQGIHQLNADVWHTCAHYFHVRIRVEWTG